MRVHRMLLTATSPLLLLLLWQATPPTLGMGLEVPGQDDQMTVTFNGLYSVIFSAHDFKKFYECLCSSETNSCQFSYKSGDNQQCKDKSRDCHGVREVWASKIYPHSPAFGSHVFECERPNLEQRSVQTTSCTRTRTRSCDTASGFSKWQFYDNSCSSGCVSLCWREYEVSYSTGSSRVVPDSGQCLSSMTESTPRVTTWGGASLVSTAGITPGFPTITSYTSVPTTSTSGVNGHIGGNNIGVTVNHGNETSSHVATYIGLACGLLVSIAIASVVIIRCRRKRTSRQKKEEMRLSFTDIQPYACSGEEKEGYMDVTETPPVLCEAAKSNVLDSACVDPASVYCTIADRDLTQVNQSAGNKTANVTEPRPPIRPRRYSLTQLSQDVEETIGVREVAEFCMDGNVYSELTNVGQSSPEDHPPALDCTAQVAEGGHKTATATGVYNKLNSNGRGSSGLQVNVLKSYNMAAGQLEVSKKDRESSEKNDITGQTANPYCLAREPNAVQKTQSSEANVDGSDGQSKNHTVDNNCHIIQAVAACSRVGGKENTYEQTDLNNSDLFDGGSTNNISRTDVSQESTGCLPGTESTEYFELEAGDDPYLVSGIPVPEQNEHTPNQTEEYFVLEDNEEGNVEGECRGVVGDDGFHEYHKPMHDHGVDDVHIYHEIQSGYEKTEYAELD